MAPFSRHPKSAYAPYLRFRPTEIVIYNEFLSMLIGLFHCKSKLLCVMAPSSRLPKSAYAPYLGFRRQRF